MSRDLTARFAEALTERNVSVAVLLEGEYASGTVRHHTGIGTLTWNGYDWTGLGHLIGLGPVEESDSLKASGLAVTLRGVTAADISLALGEFQLNKPGAVRLALFEPGLLLGDPAADMLLGEPAIEVEIGDGADYIGEGANVFGHSVAETVFGVPGGGIIDTPKIVFKGRFDGGGIDDSNPAGPVLNVAYENELIDLERPLEWRFTDEHQKKLHPNDRAFEYVAKLQDKEIPWGRR